MAGFQQIVTQNGVFRKTSVHGSLERVHIVNSFSDKRAFLENILIHVGDFSCVRINTGIACKKPNEPRTPGARQTHSDAGLQNAVAFGDDPSYGVEFRAV